MKIRQSEEVLELHNHYTDIDQIQICWYLTAECNKACPYCFEGDKTDSSKYHIDEEIILNRAKNLDTLFNKITQSCVKLHLCGGEPTLYDIVSILKNINSPKLNEVGLITNFTREPDYYIDIANYCIQRDIKFSLTISYHEFFDYEEFISNLVTIRDTVNNPDMLDIKINCVVDNDNINKEFIERLVSMNFNVKTSLLRTARTMYQTIPTQELIDWQQSIRDKSRANQNLEVTYTDGTTEWFDHIDDFRSRIEGGFFTDGYYCSAGITSLQINSSGNIVRAICSYLNSFKPLGNIDNVDSVVIPTKWMHCNLQEGYRCIEPGRLNIKKNL